MTVVATGGHVDHGKSTLVRALTGTDPDRFAEEKARGLTIDLGFAFTTLPSGAEISFVDVPGHVRYLDNMLAGVGAVRCCLFVVDATEGWKPQSEEHLRILGLLGVDHGVVALTKCSLVDGDTVALAGLEVAERLEGSAFALASIVAVDSLTGEGLDALRDALDTLVSDAPAAPDLGRPRLWVDRSFAAKGAGSVVTGTLTGGWLSEDDVVDLVPGGQSARVRGLQHHGDPISSIPPGRRVAVNLVGVEHRAVTRGDAVLFGRQWAPTKTFDASLTVLSSLDHPVSRRGAHRLHVGSGVWPVRVRVLGPNSLAPGERGAVRIHSSVALALLPGDRYVLRESGRAETVGGGEVLDVAPVLPASRARPDRSIARVVAERGWIEIDQLERLTGERIEPTVGGWAVDPSVVEAYKSTGGIERAKSARGMPPTALGRALVDAFAPRPEHDDVARHPFLAALRAEPFSPPPPNDVDGDVLRRLRESGLAIERDGIWFAAEAVDAAARTVAQLLADTPDGLSVTQVRTALGTTRKYVVPLLGHLDAAGVTRRRGDVRMKGPRLPSV